MSDAKLKIEIDDTDSLAAEIRFGSLILTMEVDDPEGGVGAFVRTIVMPSKTQAAALAAFLNRWATP